MLIIFITTFMIMITGIIYPHFKIWSKFYLNFVSRDIAFIYMDIMDKPNSWVIDDDGFNIEITKKDSIIKFSKKRIDIGIHNYYVRTNLLEANFIKNAIFSKKEKFKKLNKKVNNEVK
jgi:hypothetical protein